MSAVDGVIAIESDAVAPITTNGILVSNDRRDVVDGGGGEGFTMARIVVALLHITTMHKAALI